MKTMLETLERLLRWLTTYPGSLVLIVAVSLSWTAMLYQWTNAVFPLLEDEECDESCLSQTSSDEWQGGEAGCLLRGHAIRFVDGEGITHMIYPVTSEQLEAA